MKLYWGRNTTWAGLAILPAVQILPAAQLRSSASTRLPCGSQGLHGSLYKMPVSVREASLETPHFIYHSQSSQFEQAFWKFQGFRLLCFILMKRCCLVQLSQRVSVFVFFSYWRGSYERNVEFHYFWQPGSYPQRFLVEAYCVWISHSHVRVWKGSICSCPPGYSLSLPPTAALLFTLQCLVAWLGTA